MSERLKQNYILLIHHESCSIFIVKEEEWNDGLNPWNDGLVEEQERFDDLDFASYEGELLAKKLNYEFGEYVEPKEQIKVEETPFDIPELREITEGNLVLLIKSKSITSNTLHLLEYDLKYCGRAFIDKNEDRINPIKVKTEEGKHKLIK